MKANQSHIRVWRAEYLPSIPQSGGYANELVHSIAKASSLPRHFHEELELVIRQGDGWQFNYRGAMYSVPSDTLVVTQPGEVHHANWMSERDCTFRGLRIDLDLLQQVALEIAGHKTAVPFFPIPLVHDRDLTRQIVRVHQSLSQSGCQLEQETTIQDLVAQLILRCAANPPCLTRLGTERQPIERVRAYLEDYYSQEISLEQLAQIAELSSFHLNRSFRQTFGMPPHAYQIQLRILKAKRLLRQELSITSGRLRQRESSH
jgi:AraC-like DNA-binding protein